MIHRRLTCVHVYAHPSLQFKQSAITNEICEIVAGASSVDSDKGGNAKELLAFEYESGDEFEAERIREFGEWFATLDECVREPTWALVLPGFTLRIDRTVQGTQMV